MKSGSKKILSQGDENTIGKVLTERKQNQRKLDPELQEHLEE